MFDAKKKKKKMLDPFCELCGCLTQSISYSLLCLGIGIDGNPKVGSTGIALPNISTHCQVPGIGES